MEALSVACDVDPGTAARSALYRLLAEVLAFPDGLAPAVADGGLRAALASWSAALPYALPPPPDALADPAAADDALAADYIRLFDVGVGGPPCPLHGGVYQGDRMRTMEEATRFYHFFGLRLAPPLRELPDHVTTELEFLHYLTFREIQTRAAGGDPTPLLRAQRDFLARHPCTWMPRMAQRLARQEAQPFYPALVGWALDFLHADAAWAAARAEAD